LFSQWRGVECVHDVIQQRAINAIMFDQSFRSQTTYCDLEKTP
jgi:hypothetical protein